MADSDFYENKGPFSIREIIKELNCKFIGDKNFLVHDISTLELSCEKDLTFLSNKKYINEFNKTNAGVIIIEEKFAKEKKSLLFNLGVLFWNSIPGNCRPTQPPPNIANNASPLGEILGRCALWNLKIASASATLEIKQV